MNDSWRAKFILLVLGPFDLTGPDRAVDVPHKTLAGLLAYLACTAPEQHWGLALRPRRVRTCGSPCPG